MNEIPVACALSGAAYHQRMIRIQRLGAAALLDAERRPDRAILRFRRDPSINRELRQIRDAEAECCGFLRLELTEEPNATVLSIASSNPDGAFMIDVLAGVFGQAAPKL